MAHEKYGSEQEQAESVTGMESACPTWEALGGGLEMPPFFSPGEEMKHRGFQVKFLTDGPRKESPNPWDETGRELWFDIEHQGKKMTWTISQISLLVELKRLAPLAGKTLSIELVPVDDKFRQKWPRFRGKERYEVKLVKG